MVGTPRVSILYDGCTFYAVWQCHNKDWLLQNWVKHLYYDLLLKYKDDYLIQFYAYHLMENHAHLIGRTASVEGFGCFFRVVHNLLARKVNKYLNRRGQLIMNRPESSVIDDDRHLISVMTYSDLNGVRAGRDRSPEESTWSSYNFYAHGKKNSLITSAPSYLALSSDPKMRQLEYRAIVQAMISL